MESYSNSYGYDDFNDYNQHQSGSSHDGLHGGVLEGWTSGEDFHLGMDHSQSIPAFEPKNGSTQSSFATELAGSQPSFNTEFASSQSSSTREYASSQSSSHTAIGEGGSNYSCPIWTAAPHETTEVSNCSLSSNGATVHTNFRQEANSSVRMAQSPIDTTFVPQYDVRPPPVSPFTTFQPMGNEHVESLVNASQQSLPAREIEEDPFYNDSLYVMPTPSQT
jgi:hypothetical protein